MISRKNVYVQLELLDINRLCCECRGVKGTYEYAFYVMKDDTVIDKLPYQKGRRYVYWLTEPGVYSIKVFVRNETEKMSFRSGQVVFEGRRPIVLDDDGKKKQNLLTASMMNVRNTINEIVVHRERMLRISRYDYRVLNKDAYLGNVWNILNPLIQIATYWFVFGFGIRGGQDVDGIPYLIWMLGGMVPWFYLSAGITQGAGAIRQKGMAVLKMRYPVATIPLEQILVQFYSHITMVAILALTYILMGYLPTVYWLNLIYYFAYGIVFLTSLSMVTSVLSMIALDFQKLINALIRLLFYLTPILWSLDRMPENIGKILQMNPVYYYVNGFRESLLYRTAFFEEPQKLIFFWGINLILFLCGCNLITKYKDQFIDLQ